MSNSVSQGVYSPLPQSISDSESEEELHSAIPQPKYIDTSKHLNGIDLRNYHHLNDLEDNRLNGFPNINSNMLDDSPMIKDNYKKTMSPIRKFFFTLSILICFFTIVVFLWILPCSEDATCPAVVEETKISNWEKPYHGIELMGPINVVKGMEGHSKNLVLLFRGDVVNPNPVQQGPQNIPPKEGGAISIMGDTGKVAWYIPRQRLPTDMDCSLLDVDKNGNPDCILTGAEGMLEIIDPISGSLIWCIHIHNNSNSLITSVDFPVIISDIDEDEVNDIVTSCSLNNSNHNIIVVVSGRVGNILGKPYVVKNCDYVHNLEIDDNLLSYSCQKNDQIKKMFIKLYLFYKQVIDKPISPIKIQKQHVKAETNTDNQRMIYAVNGRQLIVSNQGKCPGTCSVSVKLIDQRDPPGQVSYSYNGKNVYGMVPTSMKFKNSENNHNSLQGHINGFILKYWQWNDIKTENAYHKEYLGSEKIVKRNLLDDVLCEQKLPWFFPVTRQKRSLLDKTKNVSITEQMLTERVSLITFNSSNCNVVNASQSDVTQLCAHAEKMYCQPDLSLQKNSVLIADLDDDGSKELISYLSTFVISDDYDENNNVKYQLQSSVKVVRLESELPKLYEAVTKY